MTIRQVTRYMDSAGDLHLTEEAADRADRVRVALEELKPMLNEQFPTRKLMLDPYVIKFYSHELFLKWVFENWVSHFEPAFKKAGLLK
jgi:hypothetical protein